MMSSERIPKAIIVCLGGFLVSEAFIQVMSVPTNVELLLNGKNTTLTAKYCGLIHSLKPIVGIIGAVVTNELISP